MTTPQTRASKRPKGQPVKLLFWIFSPSFGGCGQAQDPANHLRIREVSDELASGLGRSADECWDGDDLIQPGGVRALHQVHHFNGIFARNSCFAKLPQIGVSRYPPWVLTCRIECENP